MKLSDFNYNLPPERIAQVPLPERDGSGMLLLNRQTGLREDSRFSRLAELVRGDELIVVNNARVFPARLLGRRAGVKSEPLGTRSSIKDEYLSATIEVLLVKPLEEENTWEALVRPGRKVRVGERLVFGKGEEELTATVLNRGEYGLRTLRLECAGDFCETVERLGHVPLPPYIDRPDEQSDRERYQTVFARQGTSVAAPTAGLHFTPATLEGLRQRGCQILEITLDIGYGTFQPIHTETVEEHLMHAEHFEISEEASAAIEQGRREGRPLLAVGTTVVRALESAAGERDRVEPGAGETGLFIYPGYEFKVVDQLLTNFHLPQSSLLILVAAFAGREKVLAAYRHAVEQGYRFYSYGDCMLIR